MSTTDKVVRWLTCIHTFALLTLPKNSAGLMSYRPEDVTAVFLFIAFMVLVASGRLAVPSRSLTVVTIAYLSYFFVALLVHDFHAGYYQAFVFWAKEASFIVYGYLVWYAYRSAPGDFLDVAALAAIPNIVYGIYQLATTPRGMYGVAPFGHSTSPSSAGMVYLAFAMVMFMRCVTRRREVASAVLLILSMALLLTAGSKVAVLGAVCFFGWYLMQFFLQKRDIQSLVRVGGFATGSAVCISIAVSAARLGYSWRGLARYRGLLQPFATLKERGIWWKISWVDSPHGVFVGAGYSPGHVSAGEPYGFGMAMDNQLLYYAVTGGIVALAIYALLMVTIYTRASPRGPSGRMLRALVIGYVVMGLGGEVLQLSVHGNVFWMIVGLCLAMKSPPAPQEV